MVGKLSEHRSHAIEDGFYLTDTDIEDGVVFDARDGRPTHAVLLGLCLLRQLVLSTQSFDQNAPYSTHKFRLFRQCKPQLEHRAALIAADPHLPAVQQHNRTHNGQAQAAGVAGFGA